MQNATMHSLHDSRFIYNCHIPKSNPLFSNGEYTQPIAGELTKLV